MFVDLGDVRINYERSGSGTPVVLITGLVGDTGFWSKTVPLMEGCDVITLDNRGAGLTECRGRFSLEDMADDVVRLMDHLGIASAHVLGWSMGSHIALSMAARYPDRVRTLTVASSYLRRPARTSYILDLMARWYRDEDISEEAVASFMNVLLRTEGFFRFAEENGKGVRNMRLGPREAMIMQLEAAAGYDPVKDVRRVRCPVLSIHGLEDIMSSPADGDAIADALGCEDRIRIQGDGHLLRPALYIPEYLRFIFSH